MCLLKKQLQEKDEQIHNMRRQLETSHNSGETKPCLNVYSPLVNWIMNACFHRHFLIRILQDGLFILFQINFGFMLKSTIFK